MFTLPVGNRLLPAKFPHTGGKFPLPFDPFLPELRPKGEFAAGRCRSHFPGALSRRYVGGSRAGTPVTAGAAAGLGREAVAGGKAPNPGGKAVIFGDTALVEAVRWSGRGIF